MQLQKLSLWKRGLIHSFLIWFTGNLSQFCGFLYKRSIRGDYLVYDDGRPVQALDKFTNIYLNLETVYVVLVAVFIIEVNYAYFFKKKIWIFLVTSIVTGVLISLLLHFNHVIRHGGLITNFGLESAFIVAPYAFAYPILMQYVGNRIFRAEQLYEHSAAELKILKAQINPHFFFNTLNSIYGTALREQARDTAAAIEKLANMMRYILTEGSGDFVPVNSELNFVSQFIELQEMRIPRNENIQIKTAIHQDEEPAIIAPLLLLPIIENAFKYAISMEKKSFIDLNILVQNKTLKLNLKNSIVATVNKGTGIGMENVKRRLGILYPGRHILNIADTSDVYTVELEINL